MITTITPLRRVAVTLAMAGVTAFGAVAIAPAAFAADTTTVTDPAPVVAPDAAAVPPVVDPAPAPAPVVAPPVVDPAPAPAPVVAPPVVDPAPAPAPVVAPPLVVIGKDGKPVKEPKVCKDKDLSDYAAKLAKANQQAAPLLKNAAQLRQVSALLRAQADKMTANPGLAGITRALASVSDYAASKLEAQAADVIAKVGGIGCIEVSTPNGRF